MLKGVPAESELKVVQEQPPSEEALAAFIDGLAEFMAADHLRRIREGDEASSIGRGLGDTER